jgi:hypothetical protein
MGQVDPAIICYRKSAILLQREARQHVENQGFVRKWTGELLMTRGDFCAAKIFFAAAKQKWELACPHRISEADQLILKIRGQTLNCPAVCSQDIERYCLAWIYGREADFMPL